MECGCIKPSLVARGLLGYGATMSFILRNIARYAAQKLASDPRVRESAAKAARVVVDEAEQIARWEDKALNAGRAVRRAMNKLQGRST